MFGMSAAEILILIVVGIVVVGPKKLPKMMRTAGQWIARLRRLSTDLRSQSGIDRVLREEGLADELRELRSLRESLSKQAILDTLVKAAEEANIPTRPKPAPITPKIAAPSPKETGSLALTSAAVATSAALPSPAPADDPSDSKAEVSAETSSEASATEGADRSENGTEKPALPEGAVAIGSDGSATTSSLLARIRPPEGAVSRSALGPRPQSEPYESYRLREYPSFGADHYEAFPDDIEEDGEVEGGGTEPTPASDSNAATEGVT